MQVSKEGIAYIVAEGFEWFWKQFADGTWEPNTFKIFDTFLDVERNYVDIGAWIGPTVLYASPKAKKVFAFEPDPVAFVMLTQNLKLNRAENVVVYPVAVSDKWQNIPFGAKTAFGDSMASELWGSKENTVPAISLEAIVLDLNPNFIKIDIEGGEKFIFESQSLKLALAECKPTIHLSLHTPWFKDDVESYKNAIKEAVKDFPYVYSESLAPIGIDEAFNVGAFTSVVVSFKNLNQ